MFFPTGRYRDRAVSETEVVIKEYLAAIAGHDFKHARSFLAERGFSYLSPIAHFDDADRFIANISALGGILERLEIRQLMVNGSEAVAIVDAVITIRGYLSRTVAILFCVEGGRIRRLEAIFDATDYHKMFY